ncbi:MAG TPA: translation elongation factor Ts [bacterium]|nr:translation elongation factor Ts [bacterium]HOA18271.1 translation elongation factor Ts [bacterium]
MQFNIEDVKKLREETGAGILDVKQALENALGDYEKARKELMDKVSSKAAKKADRTANDGLVYSYIHATGKVGSMLLMGCETDFVAKTEDFKRACHEVALQICTSDYKDIEELYEAEYIKDSSKKVRDIINEVTAKTGEKVEVKKFIKYVIGE